jgi:hypothetical protein
MMIFSLELPLPMMLIMVMDLKSSAYTAINTAIPIIIPPKSDIPDRLAIAKLNEEYFILNI